MTTEIETLAQQLGQLLQQMNLTVTTAESCTGGGLGYWLTSIPGSSDWFERGFITYSNAAKIEMLEVKAETLETFGAVSEQTAREMAEGALKHSLADFSVAISGVAGPAGGTIDKPVGMVWIAYAGTNMNTEAHVEHFPGNREAVRLSVIKRAIEQLIILTKARHIH